MTTDPHDNAAWRSFGMLGADESSAFDVAARQDPALRHAVREVNQLAAAIALATSRPVAPSAEHLERIRLRLALPQARPRLGWLGWSGWAAAAGFALLWGWHAATPSLRHETRMAQSFEPSPVAGAQTAATARASSRVGSAAPHTRGSGSPAETAGAVAAAPPRPPGGSGTMAGQPTHAASRESVERTREIAMRQERALFHPVPGVAMPVIMKMAPPGDAAEADPVLDPALAMNDSPVDQLFASRMDAAEAQGDARIQDDAWLAAPMPPPLPAAIPIYDAARDAGTLVLSNLPPAPEGWEYNLWARGHAGAEPVRVGMLPGAGASPSESFDFSLGSEQVVPAGFILTQDPRDQPRTPHQENTVLEGPQATAP